MRPTDMRTRTRHLTALLVALGLVLGACGGEATDTADTTETSESRTTTTAPIETSVAPIDNTEVPRLLLRIDASGGFVPVEYALTDLIDFSLYSDGRVILGPDGAGLPAINQYVETTIDEQTLVSFIGLIEQLGIAEFTDESNDEMVSKVADATTVFATYYDEDGGIHTYSVYALGMGDFVDADGRVAVMKEISALIETVDAGEAAPLPIARLEVYTGETLSDPTVHKVREWTLPFAPIQLESTEGFNFGCIELTGDTATATAEVLATADATTLWSDGAATYSVVGKPLLDDEISCGIDY